jgi:hypothetical protein
MGTPRLLAAARFKNNFPQEEERGGVMPVNGAGVSSSKSQSMSFTPS